MSPDSDQPDRQVWEDLEALILKNRRIHAPIIAPGITTLLLLNVVAVNRNAGTVADMLLGMMMEQRTTHDVASALTDLITSGFVALATLVPDVQEYWEINLRELIVKTET